jgi:hypothetical protein
LVVLASLIDVIDNERPSFFKLIEAMNFAVRNRKRVTLVDEGLATLSSMSLVHRTWTWPMQKAMGRRMVLSTPLLEDERVKSALSTPLLGPWTRSAVIGAHSESLADAQHAATLLEELLKRTPHLHQLAISPELLAHTYAGPSSRTLSALKGLKQLRELAISVPLGALPCTFNGALAGLVSSPHELQYLRVDSYGAQRTRNESEYATLEGQVNLDTYNVPDSLRGLDITVGAHGALPFVDWLFKSSRTSCGNVARLQQFGLQLSAIYEPDGEDANPIIRDYLETINPSLSFGDLRELNISLTPYRVIPNGLIENALSACTNLRLLDISHGFNVAVESILGALPSSLEALHYGLVVSSEGVVDFDEFLSRYVTAPEFCKKQTCLDTLQMSLTEEFFLPTKAINIGSIRSIQYLEVRTLRRTQSACEAKGLRFRVEWKRSVLMTARPYGWNVGYICRRDGTDMFVMELGACPKL